MCGMFKTIFASGLFSVFYIHTQYTQHGSSGLDYAFNQLLNGRQSMCAYIVIYQKGMNFFSTHMVLEYFN